MIFRGIFYLLLTIIPMGSLASEFPRVYLDLKISSKVKQTVHLNHQWVVDHPEGVWFFGWRMSPRILSCIANEEGMVKDFKRKQLRWSKPKYLRASQSYDDYVLTALDINGCEDIDSLGFVEPLISLTESFRPLKAPFVSFQVSLISSVKRDLTSLQVPPSFVLKGNQLTVAPGEYNIKQSIHIPPGYEVTISKGVTFNISKGVDIVSYSPVFAQGEESFPIKMLPEKPGESWGCFAINNNAAKPFKLNHLHMSNAEHCSVNSSTGGLSLLSSEGELNSVHIQSPQGEDGIAVVTSNIKISKLVVKDCADDCLDVDASHVEVADTDIVSARGDGIDLSHSMVHLTGVRVQKAMDKCMSVGELSEVHLNGAELKDCHFGAFVKDGSSLHAYDIKISKASVGLASGNKNPSFVEKNRLYLKNINAKDSGPNVFKDADVLEVNP
ncbi:MAG: hypothetical protein CL677_01025 [Bdellovibrionaceae bacterium]|nr:hypothetical protein [Pseudobdellovibrionaceae bacterium]|tara:strand:+ start:126247 stop:127569 length:1323 start_codon:yes stop_codon:yes gene_type:complete